MNVLTIVVPPLPRATHPNARPKLRVKLAARKRQREDASIAALAAMQCKRLLWERAEVEATFFFSVRRKRDTDNLTAWLKATLDGLEAAGVVEDDNGLTLLPPEVVAGSPTKDCVRLRVRELT
jgi:Holliday junction resolvase RusA-like endonuclease